VATSVDRRHYAYDAVDRLDARVGAYVVLEDEGSGERLAYVTSVVATPAHPRSATVEGRVIEGRPSPSPRRRPGAPRPRRSVAGSSAFGSSAPISTSARSSSPTRSPSRSTRADLALLAETFSFVPSSLLGLAAEFGQGEAVVAGKLVPSPTLGRFGPRWSQEGGADVPSDRAARRG
jgi:hypothetical protein